MTDVQFQSQPLHALTTALKDGTHGTHRRVAEGVPLLSAKNITVSGDIAFDETDELISESEYQDLTRLFRLEFGDLLLTIVGSIGRRAVYSGQRVTFQRSVAYIRPQQHKLRTRFLFHWMGHPAFSSELMRRSNATAQAGVYLCELAKVSVPVPDTREQNAVARVLDTLDTAIHETEAIIAKLKAVKQGLLHDLLTRGIDANGELRPDQTEAPHLYKASPLGWIPTVWDVKAAEEVCEEVIDCKNRTPPETASGHPVIRTPNVRGGRFVRHGLTYTDVASYSIWTQRGKPRVGDVLITREAPVGEVCLLPADIGDACLGQRMMMYRPKHDVLVGDFLVTALMWTRVQKTLADISGGSTVGHVRVGDIRALNVPVPPLLEQEAIARAYSALEQRLLSEEDLLSKFLKEKSGLMDDLLTGRVRVTPLLEAAAP